MNISVREREETEAGDGGRWRQRWREIERQEMRRCGREMENMMGQERWGGKGLKAQMGSWGLPTLPHWIQREGRGQRQEDFF